MSNFCRSSFLIAGLLCLMSFTKLAAQEPITWDILADVNFSEQYDEKLDGYWLIPEFGDLIKFYENQKVTVEGYLIIVDMTDNFMVLSKNPFSSCFFCGGAGPETVIELQFDKLPSGLKNDQRIKVEGTLKLNISNFDHCNYILSDASLTPL